MVNSLSPMPSGTGTRHTSPARITQPAIPVVSNINVSAAAHPVRALLDLLKSDNNLVSRLHGLYELQTQLVAIPESKDVFRLSMGFEVVLETLDGLSEKGAYSTLEKLELLKSAFNVFADAMFDSALNRRYFNEKIGFHEIESFIRRSVLLPNAFRQVVGTLISFIVSDFSKNTLLVSIGRGTDTLFRQGSESDKIVTYVYDRIRASLSGAVVWNAMATQFMHNLVLELHHEDVYSSVATVAALTLLAEKSSYNQVALYRTGLMDTILPLCWTAQKLNRLVCLEYLRLAKSLIGLGVSTRTAKDFYQQAMTSDETSKLLLLGLEKSREPAHIAFDLSLYGHSAIEFNTLSRSFPPASTGYTFTSWIKLDQYDANYHTTLFGVFDNSQRCFTLVYIEKETRKLILQTSITSTRGSVRFKSVSFEPGKWYFICIAHKRSRVSLASKASLYVNGEFVEATKCPYPSSPAYDGAAQAFIGTPADLASGPAREQIRSVWRLASLYIFEELLSDDVLAVHYRLGPRYYGNYQESLASFQTYEASAALTLRNERLDLNVQESSDITSAFRGRASNLPSESRILLGIHGKNIIDPASLQDDHGFRLAPKNIHMLSRSHLLVVNAAIPDINIAFSSPNGIGLDTGDPTAVLPQALDDCAWRLGGSALGLKMTELAETPEQLCRAVSITFELLRENWRNSDDMERVHGFALLANIIKTKVTAKFIDQKLLKIILEFVGYNFDEPLDSLIINPLAYRTLLVDFDIWKGADIDTLRFYFDQFYVFGLQSKYHSYNAKRLTKMRIVKKFLQTLKAETFTRESLGYFIPALKRIIQTNVSAEVMRSLSLFVTYAFNENIVDTKGEDKRDSASVPQTEVGYMVLQTFTEVLCDPVSTATMKKFARTVTNKWVLFLLAQDDSRAVISGTKILARLLVIHGSSYVTKFSSKNGGFVIMKERLKSRWSIPQLWPICLAVLFGVDIATLEITDSLDLFHLLEMFRQGGRAAVRYSEMFTVIGAMLKTGVLSIITEEHKQDKISVLGREDKKGQATSEVAQNRPELKIFAHYLQVLTQFLAEMQASCPAFQDFCASPTFVQEILEILFPVICNSESVSPEIELHSRDVALTFDGGDVVVRPASGSGIAQIMKTVRVPSPSHSSQSAPGERPRAASLRRGSSFVLISSKEEPSLSTDFSIKHLPLSKGRRTSLREVNAVDTVIEGLLEIVVAVFVNQILTRRDFSELNISILIPPTFQEFQIYFETYLFRNTVSQLNTTIFLNMSMLCDSRLLTNFGKFAQQLMDSVFNGWFLGGAEPSIDLLGRVIEYLQQPDIESLKVVKMRHFVVLGLRTTFMKLVLFRLSELEDTQAQPNSVVEFLEKILYWQNVLLSPAFTDDGMIKLICYMLYRQLISTNDRVRNLAVDNWRMVLVHKPIETSLVLDQFKTAESRELSKGFKKLIEIDNSAFLDWIDRNHTALDEIFLCAVAKDWESFVVSETKASEEITKSRTVKRRERLRQTMHEDSSNRSLYLEHKSALKHWQSAIHHAEHVKFRRNVQDHQDTLTFLSSEYAKLEIDLTRPRGVIADGKEQRWRLDLTEGRERMRKRMMPDTRSSIMKYLARENDKSQMSSNSEVSRLLPNESEDISELNLDGIEKGESSTPAVGENDEGFEIVEDPRGQATEEDGYEDKNRKVLRSLEQSDSVVDLWNVCRIIGLQSVEGLLIQGRNNLYLIDNFFQRSDGEIVNLWEAPTQERDPYQQTIAGSDKRNAGDDRQHDTRHWALDDLVSISRRQFLFRNVALEFFFADGRSFLITALSVKQRDQIHNKLQAKVSVSNTNSGAAFSDELWRTTLTSSLQSGIAGQLGKIANVFQANNSNLATRRWIKGEISNFYYLMLVNTMAGRTYNDLTQYPVFPWVIADYTSEELDLTNPASFRDLSKPMGAQTPERESEFRERYQALAETSDSSSPPFHYGTHFSSAMIVSSYLIRLEPFVQSYLLLQGGHFDHADRLFYSIELAWHSASRDNTTDVRELIPEFFYLPEFLANSNDFKFGSLQNTGLEIGDVQLPRWAKGDARLFIQKNREALESEYVSQHLHEWIDLVFGFKQRGETAVEATNVFHHLSYHGAIELDKIKDPLERIATIGIIHNFGQTPHQVFTRPHQPKEVTKQLPFQVQKDAAVLKRMLELKSTSSFYSSVPPDNERMVEWGFCDNGVRFKLMENGKLIGQAEQLHQERLTCVRIADARTLVTAGYDCMLCVWRMQGSAKSMEVQFKATLRGHTSPIVSLDISRSFSAIVSASEDGVVLVWDLNRLRFVRELKHDGHLPNGPIKSVAINDETGEIVTSDGLMVFLWTLNGDMIFKSDLH
ncbi:hypothetical protein V1512DRAFT_255310 [Lipomyces arxii]|uniref:uncharacterized protein n=1 Tax=Lipomyces arxii TaxID=56418 RepID=UPI0034CEFAB1